MRLTPRGEAVAALLLLTAFILIMGIAGGIQNGTIPLP